MTKFNYNNAKEYLNYIKDFPRKARPIVGRFVCFTYNFHTNPDYVDTVYKIGKNKGKVRKNSEKKKYLDFQPFDLVIAVRPSKETFMCINFHALPVKTRQILMAKIKKNYEKTFEKPKILIPGVNYRKMLRFLKKIGVAVRQYRFERVMSLREVPKDEIDNLMKYYANFYYKTNYNAIVTKYNAYRPKT